MTASPIRLMLADVDGTLVTQDKVLTEDAVDAVRRLSQAGILFAVTSGRPPRGMAMLVEPLDLQTPIAAFNGGLIVDRDMTVIDQRVLPEPLVVPIAELMTSFDLTVWIYRGADWYVPDPHGIHVEPRSVDGQVCAKGHGQPRRPHHRRRQDRGGQRRPRRGGQSVGRRPGALRPPRDRRRLPTLLPRCHASPGQQG